MNEHLQGFFRGVLYGCFVMLAAMALIFMNSCVTPRDGSAYKPGYLVKRSRCCTGIVIDFGPMTSTCEILTPCPSPRRP
jgi:hypothetical protein